MKASIVLALPFLSLAAAAPAKVDKRIDLSKVLEPLDCPLAVASLIPDCLPRASDGDTINLEPLTMW